MRTTRRANLGWVLAALVTLSACGALGLGAGADVREIEADYPVMSDLQIDGATRTARARSSSTTSVGGIRQRFEPDGDTTLETIADRAIAAGIEQGWDVGYSESRGAWCASKPRRDPADGFVTLEISVIGKSGVPDGKVAVNLLLLGRACTTE